MDTKYEDKLGTQKMLPLIMKMAIPAIIAQLVNLLYSMVDRIYIGHIQDIGKDALAGIGITSAIITFIAAFSGIVGMGAAPLASIELGKNNRKKANVFLGNGVFLLIIFSIFTMSISYIFMTPLLRLIGASANVLPYAKDYLTIYLLGTFFVQIVNGLNSFISIQGRPNIAMISVLIGAIANIILDPIFIFVFNMNVAGAALATIISQFLSCIWILKFLFSNKASLKISLPCLKPNKKIIWSILALGISPFVMAITESMIGFVLNNRLSMYGDIHVSALTIMQSAMQITSVPLMGFSQGYLPVISYNYGKGNVARVKEGFKIGLTIMMSFMIVFTVFMMICPGFIARIFTKDTALINIVIKYLPIFIAGMTIFGLQRVCQQTFVALGQAKVSLFIALLRKVFLLIPLAIIFSNIFGVVGVYAAESVSDSVAAICCTIIFAIKFPKILKNNRE